MAAVVWGPERQKQVVGVVLACIGWVAWSHFFFVPQWIRCGKLRAECRTLKDQMVRTRRDLAQMPQLEAQRQQLLLETARPASKIPSEQQLPDLLGRVAKAAHSSQVKVLGLRPKQDAGRKSPAGAEGGAATRLSAAAAANGGRTTRLSAATGSGFVEVPLEVSASAGYHQVGRFLDLLESSEDLLRLESIEIEGSHDDVWNHQIRMVLQAYLAPASLGS